ncbi:MAG: ATP-dependent helicase [Patescibacteria group bacterium]
MKQYTLKPIENSHNFSIDYKKELNEEQYRVVTQGDGPCLVLAGAGSGKTRALVYRVAYLLEKGVKPNRILLATFTNKAAKEMLNRIEVLLKSQPRGLWGGTFHHLGNRLLRMYGKHIGLEPNFNILDEEDSKTIVKSCYGSVAVPDDKYFPKADVIRKIISLGANLARPVAEIIEDRFSYLDKNYISLIEGIAENYQAKKKSANSLDYDDLLLEWNRLLLASAEIREKLATQFQYILVDEYQDTNHIQGEIINHLAGREQNVLVVGDDSQSIYSFRGAEVRNILTFPEDFPNCKTFRLETNYRSTPEILNLANESIRNNENQFEKKLKTDKSSGAKPVLAALADGDQQADFICQRILDLQEEEGSGLNNIAVLFRAHYQSLELEMELNKRNIPYIMRGGLRFFEQAHIKDIIAYLKILNNIHNEISWQRLLQLQSGIGSANAQKIWQKIAELPSLKEVINYPFAEFIASKVFSGWLGVKNDLEKLAAIDVNDIAALIESVLHSSYNNYLKNNYENYQDRIDDLEQLVIFAGAYDSREKFLADVALSEGFHGETIAGYEDGANEAITLSTIHQAKGLEWKAVFVIGLVDGQFPHAKVFEKPAEMEEERRLFYVATTRAQDQLYLTYPLFGLGGGQINQLSQFIKELPEDVYEEWRVKEGGGDEIRYVDEDSDISHEFWARIISKRKK